MTEVYQAISNVTESLSKIGIEKSNKNVQQGYKFRGIDDIYNALSTLLSKHKLVIMPRCIERSVTERQTKQGGVLFYTIVKVEFDFVSAIDGTKHSVVTYGEAMDSADKSTNKAMSAAYKYACIQTFCIPTEGDNDADAVTHDVAEIKQCHGEDDFKLILRGITDAVSASECKALANASWKKASEEQKSLITKLFNARMTYFETSYKGCTGD